MFGLGRNLAIFIVSHNSVFAVRRNAGHDFLLVGKLTFSTPPAR
jgi:hypothetical protein